MGNVVVFENISSENNTNIFTDDLECATEVFCMQKYVFSEE